jgi:tetratricopeptide (TPR) repeat protein
MKQSNQEKYTVAWYKLAEFVARGEKERALALYRLLAHSFEDTALSHQLEGDLFNSFHDAQAVESYQKAFELYKQHGRIIEAAAMCDYLVSLQPDEIYFAQEAVALYKKLAQQTGIVRNYQALIQASCAQKKWYELLDTIPNFQQDVADSSVGALSMQLCKSLIVAKVDSRIIEKAVELCMKWFLHHPHAYNLQTFLTQLQAVGQEWHDYASLLLER